MRPFSATDPLRAVQLDRGALTALTGVAAAAWVALVLQPDGMAMGMPAFLAGWTLMMAAMMLPSIAPLVLLHRRVRGGGRSTVALALGYLFVWAAFGLPAFVAQLALGDRAPAGAVAAVLVVAGVYQLTRLKTACLRRCRSALDFLMQRPQHGAVRLGLTHGTYCVGCCWGLMAVLVGAGAMGLAWAAAIAALVFAEKLLPAGERFARLTGIALVVTGLVITVGVVRPG